MLQNWKQSEFLFLKLNLFRLKYLWYITSHFINQVHKSRNTPLSPPPFSTRLIENQNASAKWTQRMHVIFPVSLALFSTQNMIDGVENKWSQATVQKQMRNTRTIEIRCYKYRIQHQSRLQEWNLGDIWEKYTSKFGINPMKNVYKLL